MGTFLMWYYWITFVSLFVFLMYLSWKDDGKPSFFVSLFCAGFGFFVVPILFLGWLQNDPDA